MEFEKEKENGEGGSKLNQKPNPQPAKTRHWTHTTPLLGEALEKAGLDNYTFKSSSGLVDRSHVAERSSNPGNTEIDSTLFENHASSSVSCTLYPCFISVIDPEG